MCCAHGTEGCTAQRARRRHLPLAHSRVCVRVCAGTLCHSRERGSVQCAFAGFSLSGGTCGAPRICAFGATNLNRVIAGVFRRALYPCIALYFDTVQLRQFRHKSAGAHVCLGAPADRRRHLRAPPKCAKRTQARRAAKNLIKKMIYNTGGTRTKYSSLLCARKTPKT